MAGHIISAHNGGSRENKNGLAICQKCNNNDTRSIPDMVKEEFGDDSPNFECINKIRNAFKKNWNTFLNN